MKKKTVITTEKHEVWVIRSPADAITEQQPIPEESEAGSDNPLSRGFRGTSQRRPDVQEGVTTADTNKEKNDV